jgi:hypothetical protein
LAPDDSTRCIRCRTQTKREIDDGVNTAYRLCWYCHQALSGKVAIIDDHPKAQVTAPMSRSNPRATRAFWKKRREVKGR